MLQVAGIALDGVSTGGVETCLRFPGLGFAFDIGRCPRRAVYTDTLLFTHGHIDHMGGIAWHAATRALAHLAPPTYVVPPETAGALETLFAGYRALDRSRLPHRLVPLGPGGAFTLANGMVARPFRSLHRVPCQGYGIWTRRRKLKQEYRGLPGTEIRRLRVEQGVEVSEWLDVPELAFTGDTLVEVVEREEVVRKARVLFIEVTFVDEAVSVAQCRSKGHVHLFELAERADLFENEAIVMTHFSNRYTRAGILEALDRHLPPGLRERVTPLLGRRRRGPPE